MIFRIKNPFPANLLGFRNRIIIAVGTYLKSRPIKPSEQLLNDWLLEHYKCNLADATLLLFKQMRCSYDGTNTVIFTFNRRDLNELSNLITYGNERFRGSTILQDAFRKAEGGQ